MRKLKAFCPSTLLALLTLGTHQPAWAAQVQCVHLEHTGDQVLQGTTNIGVIMWAGESGQAQKETDIDFNNWSYINQGAKLLEDQARFEIAALDWVLDEYYAAVGPIAAAGGGDPGASTHTHPVRLPEVRDGNEDMNFKYCEAFQDFMNTGQTRYQFKLKKWLADNTPKGITKVMGSRAHFYAFSTVFAWDKLLNRRVSLQEILDQFIDSNNH